MAEANAASAPPKDIKKLLTFVFMAVNLAVLGAGGFLVFQSTLGHEPKKISNEQAEKELEEFEKTLRGDPVMYTMSAFNTNLEGVPRRLIRLELSLEMMDDEGYEEVINLAPQARDSITRILNEKTFSDVESVQGKLHLKNQIIAELNSSLLKKGVVKNVYFSDLVVQ
jgi:flagellar FliL protein